MPRNSILNDEQKVREAAQLPSIKDALISLNLRAAGGNYKKFKEACVRFGITVPQYDVSGKTAAAIMSRTLPLDEIFCENSTYTNRHHMKTKLIRLGWEYQCSECGLGDEWNGKPIVLQLDHINGIHNDNRYENLRFLCPNCHSQTPTFGRKAHP